MRGACREHGQLGTKAGYGHTGVRGKTEYIHRVAYCKAHGLDIEDIRGKVVMHTCDNPRCYNPEHLRLGTHQDNTDDMIAKGRARKATGEALPQSKITMQVARDIRASHVPRCRVFGGRALARTYGISESTVREILNNEIWKEVPLEG